MSWVNYASLFGNSNGNVDRLSVGRLTVTSIPPRRIIISNTDSEIIYANALTNGQVLIGKTNDFPQAATLTGSSNVIIVNGAGTISFNTPQDIGTDASPTFQNVTVDNITANTATIAGSISLTGSLTVNSLQVNNDTAMIGNLAVGGNVLVSGTVDGRDISNDGKTLDDHVANVSNPHSTTATQVGLGNVTNESKATMFTDPVLTGTVIAAGRNVGTDGTVQDAHIANVSNPHGVTATQVGLGNVTNESKATMFTNSTFTGTTTVASMTNTGLTATRLVATDASKVISSVTIANSNGANTSFSGSTLACSNSQDLQSSASPTFAGINFDDVNTAFTLKFQSLSSNTANRTISWDSLNGSRVIQIGGDIVTAGDFNTVSGNISLTTSGSCVATIPAGTSTLANLSTTQSFTGQKSFALAPLPVVTNTTDLGSSSFKWKDMYLTGRIDHTGPVKIGNLSGGTDANVNNLFVGVSAGENWLTGTSSNFNTGIGTFALRGTSATSCDNCTAVGHSALRAITTGVQNTAVGQNALTGMTTSSRCVGIGYQCANSGNGDDTTVVGYRAGINTAASSGCTYVGSLAGASASGSGSGINNVGVGFNCMGGTVMTTATQCMAVGYGALNRLTTGNDNVALGWAAGSNLGAVSTTGITTGNSNVLIGSDSAVSAAASINRIAIGARVLNSVNNTAVIGNSSCTDITLTGNVLNPTANTYNVGSLAVRYASVYTQSVRLSDGTSRSLILTGAEPATSSRTITFEDPLADCKVVYNVLDQSIAGIKSFSTSIKLATASGTAAAMDYFETETVSVNATGIWASGQAVSIYVTRTNKMVTLFFTPVIQTASVGTIISFSAALAAKYRPVSAIYQMIGVSDNMTENWGQAIISTGGAITILKNVGSFSGLSTVGPSGFYGFGMTYRTS